MASYLQRIKVFYDSSLHEGFGLMPLEAALCGCRLVLSDSGGVRDFALNFGAEMVTICPDPAKTFTVLEKACAKKGVNKPKLSTNFGDSKSWCEFITKNIQEVNPKLDNIRAFSTLNRFNFLVKR